MILKSELHILISCSDARDMSQLHIDAIDEMKLKYKEADTEIQFHSIRVPGCFITDEVLTDIKQAIEKHLRIAKEITDTRYYIHIQSHGHLTDDSSKEYISHVYQMKIVEGSPLNCGMLNATPVGMEIEKMLVEEQPEITIEGKKLLINSDTKIKQLLHEVYAYEGFLAGDFIKSIDYLRTHPRTQRTKLERALRNDAELKLLDIKITSGIQDYSIHGLIRVDDGDPAVPFWDDVQLLIRKKISEGGRASEMMNHMDALQKPLAVLWCMSNRNISQRAEAVDSYLKQNGLKTTDDFLPNIVFNMTGCSLDISATPFGPYIIAGFYFSIKYLGLTNHIILGDTNEEAERMIQKILNDPIMNLIAKKFNVQFKKIVIRN